VCFSAFFAGAIFVVRCGGGRGSVAGDAALIRRHGCDAAATARGNDKVIRGGPTRVEEGVTVAPQC